MTPDIQTNSPCHLLSGMESPKTSHPNEGGDEVITAAKTTIGVAEFVAMRAADVGKFEVFELIPDAFVGVKIGSAAGQAFQPNAAFDLT